MGPGTFANLLHNRALASAKSPGAGVMEYLVIAVILYFIVQVGGNLVHLLRGQGPGAAGETDASGRAPSQGDSRQGHSSQEQQWAGPSPRAHATDRSADPRFWGDDIEEATWRDVDG